MKRAALLALLLAGCTSNYNPPTVVPTPPVRIAYNYTKDIMWVCSEEEVNNSLVWIKCDFVRTIASPANVCISVSYYSDLVPGWDWADVASKKVCSGDLTDSKYESTKYIAFNKYERKTLNEFCGNNLTKCTLTAHATEP